MSFILDAIAKSERERQEQEMPNAQVLSLPVEKIQRKRRSLPYIFIAALLLNAALFAVWMQSDPQLMVIAVEEKNQIEQALAGDSGVTEAAQPMQRLGQTPVEIQTLSREQAEHNNLTERNSSQVSAVIKNESEELQQEQIALQSEDETNGWVRIEPGTLLQNTNEGIEPESIELSGRNSESKPLIVSRLYDLPEEVRNNLPTVKFSGHLYSSDPAASVVFLDNQRPVRQGQRIVDEVFLHEITATGVVVKFRGYLISVGVLQNWTLN